MSSSGGDECPEVQPSTASTLPVDGMPVEPILPLAMVGLTKKQALTNHHIYISYHKTPDMSADEA